MTLANVGEGGLLRPTIGTEGLTEVAWAAGGAVVGGAVGFFTGSTLAGASLGGGLSSLWSGWTMRQRGVALEGTVFVPEIDGTPPALRTYGWGLMGLGAAATLVGGALIFKKR